MKAWKNDQGNWCFEFERDEHEAERFSVLVSQGTRMWRDDPHRDKIPETILSSVLFNRILSVIFVGSNYTGNYGTIDHPQVYRAHDMALDLLTDADTNPEQLTDTEIDVLRASIDHIKVIL